VCEIPRGRDGEEGRPDRWARHCTKPGLLGITVLKTTLSVVVELTIFPRSTRIFYSRYSAYCIATISRGRAAGKAKTAAAVVGFVEGIVDYFLENKE
jgi:hypothetical protein